MSRVMIFESRFACDYSPCKKFKSRWGRSKLIFLLFLTERSAATKCFLLDQKLLFLAKVISFWNLEKTGNYSRLANFNSDFPKMAIFVISNLYSPNISSPIILKLVIVVLRVNLKKFCLPEFLIMLLFWKNKDVKNIGVENLRVKNPILVSKGREKIWSPSSSVVGRLLNPLRVCPVAMPQMQLLLAVPATSSTV